MKKPTVAVIFGSRSTEHDISILTALAAVIKPLELSQKCHVLPVYIAKDGHWYTHAALGDIRLYQSGKLETFLAKQKHLSVAFDKGLNLVVGSGLRSKTYQVDIVFPALHGTHGEDGEVMALCELADVPYVGCGVEASVIAMDKVVAKQTVMAAGIATPAFHVLTKQSFAADNEGHLQQITSHLQYPLFVKPAHLGSSIGITRVTTKKELFNAIEVALHYDDKALVEEAVPNLIEVTLPIMGNDELRPALLERPLVSAEQFFDFDTKYMQGGKKGKSGAKNGKQGAQGYSQIPADLAQGLYQKAEQTGLDAYRAIGCTGTARIDMLIDSKAGTVYFNEVNPLPGSLYAHNWAKAGISNVQLVTQLVDLAMQRHAERQMLATSFATSYLQQFS
ncbi:MAG TPA: D-alanine--D-alanine ligase family protein [Candidatus Saccharimonadales bacterium]|nr:D-alanine--D-alanine ligase family protein [Candidatus Saccharimonadales bacterium]